MRLIDADRLLSKLNKAYAEVDAEYQEAKFDSFYGGECSAIQEIIKEVEKQPASYDIDKVVERLKKEADMAISRIGESMIEIPLYKGVPTMRNYEDYIDECNYTKGWNDAMDFIFPEAKEKREKERIKKNISIIK